MGIRTSRQNRHAVKYRLPHQLRQGSEFFLLPTANTIFAQILIEIMEQIDRDNLIYWIDRDFVQNTAQKRIGRNLTDDEIAQLTKLVEFGLWDVVYDTVKIAIDEVSQ